MIPEIITQAHILSALKEIDPNNIPASCRSTGYDLLYEGRRYPPKYVVSIAHFFAAGEELSRNAFFGGWGKGKANTFLESRGFLIVPKAD